MSQSKSSTPRKSATNKTQKKSRADLRKELAHHISAIFNNPETPPVLSNYLGEGMTEVFNSVRGAQFDKSEEYTLAVLNEVAKAEAKGDMR
jgi:hypothetical protein